MKKNNLQNSKMHQKPTGKSINKSSTTSRKNNAREKQKDLLGTLFNKVNNHNQAKKVNELILSIKKMIKEIKIT